MSLSSNLITYSPMASVSMCTPGMQTPDGYVIIRPINPGPTEGDPVLTADYRSMLFFRLIPGETDPDIGQPKILAQINQMIGHHFTDVLKMDGLDSTWELVSVHWF